MKNFPVTAESMQMPHLTVAEGRGRMPGMARPRAGLLRGRAAISAQVEMLEALCGRTGQAGAMHWLDWKMRRPTEAKKIPTLLLVGLNANVEPGAATVDDVAGAVLLYEYKLAGCGLRVFATDDTN
ncbi:MAG TPA: hypothetical protein VGU23_00595, partial [Acidobacteriaceae bacterium]|nr:hypothetical protein [Acidobacteriaceae bacterium]